MQDSFSSAEEIRGSKETRLLQVWLYANDHIIEGTVHCFPQQRFIDYLNGIYTFRTRAADQFISVDDANVTLPDGTSNRIDSLCLNRNSILFAGEAVNEPIEESDIKSGLRTYPVVIKIPVSANLYLATKLYTNAYLISGKMHLAKNKTVMDILNTDQQFIPLTEVEISPPLFVDQIPDTLDFIAVNKDIIIYIEQL